MKSGCERLNCWQMLLPRFIITVYEHKTYAFNMKVSELCIMASFDNQYNIRILIFVRMEIHVGTIT